jgi:hypothetical protein
MRRAVDAATLRLASLSRLSNGGYPAARRGPTPTPKLELYEYEASPYCRRVRETLCVLGLRATVLPCPRETLRLEGAYSDRALHKPNVVARGGRLSFPFLYDHTADAGINESQAIVEHLWSRSGENVVERPRVDRVLNGRALPRPVDFALLVGPSGLRPWPSAGLMAASASKPAELPLLLHACEPEPGSRLVRERLCELQLRYELIPTSPRSPLPHLEDPNTDFKCFGARAALAYLEDTYRLGPTLSWGAPVPQPNLGDRDRTSWLTHALELLPQRWL